MKKTLNRSMTIVRTLLPGLLLAATAAVAGAQEGDGLRSERGVRGELPERQAQRMARVLQLTEDQKSDWRRLHEEHGANVRTLIRDMRNVADRLDAEAELEDPDPAVVGQLELDRRQIARQVKASRDQLDEDLTRLLDHDQMIRWEALRENERNGRRRPLGPGGPRPR